MELRDIVKSSRLVLFMFIFVCISQSNAQMFTSFQRMTQLVDTQEGVTNHMKDLLNQHFKKLNKAMKYEIRMNFILN